MSLSSPIPNDLVHCQTMIQQLRQELGAAHVQIEHLEALLPECEQTITDLQQIIQQLKDDNALLKRSLFGSRRERYDDPAQTLLFAAQTIDAELTNSNPDNAPTSMKSSSKKRKSLGRRRRVFPDFLPREEERYYLNEDNIPEEMRNHPHARRFFKKLGDQLKLIPMQLKVIERYQEVIVIDQPDEIVQVVSARRPATLISSYVDTNLLAYLTVSRFADHLPYYRLEDILSRCGFRIHRSTQWRWMHRLATAVTPLLTLMGDRVRQSQVIVVDETPIKELGGSQPGKSLKGYLWTMSGDATSPYDCFFYSSNRRSLHPKTFLTGFEGYLLSDAYIGYEQIGELWPGVLKASCWVHARRKFEECHHLGATVETHKAMDYFRRLFKIENTLIECSAEERLAIRQEKSKPIVNEFHEWIKAESKRQLPKAKLLGAMNYMLNRWDSFTRFLESGLVPLDNNQAERCVKYPILGRKAWLFVGNAEAGETAAKLFTLTKTCTRLRIDPMAYLQDVYARLPTCPVEEFLPDRWIANHPEHVVSHRVQEALDRAAKKREHRRARASAEQV